VAAEATAKNAEFGYKMVEVPPAGARGEATDFTGADRGNREILEVSLAASTGSHSSTAKH
jgi:hypothetical protein